jgi:HPt (histidine-containing phosphotransfer) domain-containing protein
MCGVPELCARAARTWLALCGTASFWPDCAAFEWAGPLQWAAVMDMAQPALDPSVVETLRGLQMPDGPDLLGQITAAFLEDAQSRLGDLRRAMASDDRTQIKRITHSLRGMCGAIGAQHMAALSSELERTPITASVDTGLLSQLEREFTRVRVALRVCLKG